MIVLNLNKEPELTSESLEARQLEDKTPELLEQIRNEIEKAQKDRVSLLSRVIHNRFVDMGLNLIPGVGDVKSVIETTLAKTLSRDEKLSFSERLVWAACTAFNLAGHLAIYNQRYDIAALAYGAKYGAGLATTVMLNKKEIIAFAQKTIEFVPQIPEKTAQLLIELKDILLQIPDQIFNAQSLDMDRAIRDALENYGSQSNNE